MTRIVGYFVVLVVAITFLAVAPDSGAQPGMRVEKPGGLAQENVHQVVLALREERRREARFELGWGRSRGRVRSGMAAGAHQAAPEGAACARARGVGWTR